MTLSVWVVLIKVLFGYGKVPFTWPLLQGTERLAVIQGGFSLGRGKSFCHRPAIVTSLVRIVLPIPKTNFTCSIA